jgi:hypothetical protein
MVAYGIHYRPADSQNYTHHLHSPFEKSLIERTMQHKKAELKALMTIFLAIEKRNVISFMSKTGLPCL